MAAKLPPRTASGRFRKRKSPKKATRRKLPARKANGQFKRRKGAR
jgi:hypothetical protein